MTKDESLQSSIFQNERNYKIDNVNICVRSSFNGQKNLNDALFILINDKFQNMI